MNHEGNEEEVQVIAAEVECAEAAPTGSDPRVEELERRIRELEAAIGDLRIVNASAAAATGRKTHGAHPARMMAKGVEPEKTRGIDTALGSLSVEQRLAVKAGLLRAGLL